jgi:acyl phosphate:glycerol-3-phosphate acyltransferase
VSWVAFQTVAVVAGGFVVGAVNPATLLARALGRDLRRAGSGNPGAANAGRVLGKRWGVLVLVLDVAKAYAPTALVLRSLGTVPALAVGLAAVLGHAYSPFLRGRGGKGVACALGAIVAVQPWWAVAAVAVFGVARALLPQVGEASVVTALGLFGWGAVALTGLLPGVEPVLGGWLVLLCLVVVWRHRRNVRAWWMRRSRGRREP